jgi:virginiamycin B lyase
MSRSAAVLAALVVLTACSSDTQEGGSAQPAQTGAAPGTQPAEQDAPSIQRFDVPQGAGPHDVAPAAGGGVWFTAQHAGYLGHLDPQNGKVTRVPLGSGSRPHGVITGPDNAAWVTDGGLNAIVRVDGTSRKVRRFPLPAHRAGANLNTATFDGAGTLWFTGQSGIYGRLDPDTGKLDVYDAPRGAGPYGITTTPDGDVYYASLAGSHIAQIATDTGKARVLEPPTEGQGARRVWSDSKGCIWVSEYNSGKLGRYDPGSREWKEWPLPGDSPQPYAVFVDGSDVVWVSDFGSDRLLRFDPATETFTPARGAAPAVRQIHGRAGEVWGPASGTDELLLIRTGPR